MSKTKITLLKTSSGADVVVTGNKVKITGLPEIRKQDVYDYSLKLANVEVSQVVTIGATAYTPAGNTKYVIAIGDINRMDHSFTENLKYYSYTTPSDITTLGATAALQREAITLAIVAKVNAAAYNYVVAASLLLGTGFTITDKAGYFPYNRQGMNNRRGASLVRVITNTDGTGFAKTNISLTTAAVYAFGQGQDLLNDIPVYDIMTGNLISGELDAAVTSTGLPAVVAQKYNAFSIAFSRNVANASGFGGTKNVSDDFVYVIYVDNGTGAVTTNLAGYGTFKTALDAAFA
jgi:hypothetical protein